MRQYAVRRLLIAIPVLILVTLMAASLTRLAPGDAILQRVAEAEAIVSVEELEALRHEVGLDRPFLVAVDADFPFIHPSEGSQYFSWVGGIFKGDLGTSLSADQRPIADILKRAIPVSLELAIIATLISLFVAIPIGIWSAIRQDSVGDYGGRIFAIAGLSVPDFIIGMLVLTLGAIWFKWTPPLFYEDFFDNPRQNLLIMATPALIVGFRLSSITARMLRSSMLEVLRQDYVRTAWSKGLRERTIILRHAIKNAFIPVITILGAQLGFLVGGVAITETIFNLPGVGRETINAIGRRDLPLIQTAVLFFGVSIILINLLVDLSYAWLDPRIRYS